MPGTDKALMAHLLRRAGFGATFQELDRYCQMGYEAAVEEILHPEVQPSLEEDVLERYYIDWKESRNIEGALTEFVYRMNAHAGPRPLQEKTALFWHGGFCNRPRQGCSTKRPYSTRSTCSGNTVWAISVTCWCGWPGIQP